MNNSRTTLIVGLLLAVLVGLVIFSGAGYYATIQSATLSPKENGMSYSQGIVAKQSDIFATWRPMSAPSRNVLL